MRLNKVSFLQDHCIILNELMLSFSIPISEEGHFMEMYYLFGNLLKKCSCFFPFLQLTKIHRKLNECFITYLNMNYF